MSRILSILQIMFGITLIVLILLQSQSSGLSSTWGGTGGFYHTKRGMEKVVFTLTIIVSILFCLCSLTVFLF